MSSLTRRILTAGAWASILILMATWASWTIWANSWVTVGVGGVLAYLLVVFFDNAVKFGIAVAIKARDKPVSDKDEIFKHLTEVLGRHGLRPVSMHKAGGGDDDDALDAAAEEELGNLLHAHAESLEDGDLKEAFFHMAHIMTQCPGSVAHAVRLTELSEHLETRLKASKVPPTNDSDRRTLH